MAEKKAAAKKTAAPKPDEPPDEPDVSDVRISTKWDSALHDRDWGEIRTYDFGDGTTGKAWKNKNADTWNVAIADSNGRILSTHTGSDLTVEQANVLLENAGAAAEAELAKRKALSD